LAQGIFTVPVQEEHKRTAGRMEVYLYYINKINKREKYMLEKIALPFILLVRNGNAN
jgi:hypothetical protein